jgi:KDO2-lipid IV(A) lauroyltransferase
MPQDDARRAPLRDRLQFWAIRALIGAVLLLPYRLRVPLMGWLVARLVAPALGWTRRIRANLAMIFPQMPQDEIRRLTREVPDNWGRSLIEIFSGPEFARRVAGTPLSGPGAEAFRAARAAGRPVILVTGHFGNYDAPRAALHGSGHPLAALYREMRIAPFNDWYVDRIGEIGRPVYPATRKGITDFLRHLKEEGLVGILIDLHVGSGAPLSFFGHTARTATSTAEWALKYQAEVFPIYGRRREDGLSFDIILDDPVPASDPETMTQALNDSLERMVRHDMGQWFWIHRRWKDKGAPPPG